MKVAMYVSCGSVSALSAFAVFVGAGSGTTAWAQDTGKPFVSPMFADNMVLQRDRTDPIWGWANPGERVQITVGDKVTNVTAGRDGKWEAKIGPFPAGGPYTLSVTGSRSVTFSNVLFGDVWICSGQSNMEFGIGNIANPQPEIAAANYPNIRLFTVGKNVAANPQATLTALAGTWQVCTPETVAKQGVWNGFSAVGYYFGRDLNRTLNVPIGLIHTSWGGTPAEAWTSQDSLKTMADFQAAMKLQDEMRAAEGKKPSRYDSLLDDWYRRNDPISASISQVTDASGWPTMTLPGFWEKANIPEPSAFDGVIWYHREVEISAAAAGKDLTLHFHVDDNDTTWVNGTEVGRTEGYLTPRDYKIPASLLKPGKNVITIRVLDTGGDGGIYGNPDQLTLTTAEGQTIPLAGAWQYKIGGDLKKASPYPGNPFRDQNSPTVLYNGMIAPVLPFGIKGAIWYQGESNAGRAYQYRTLLPTMIEDWRKHWGKGAFPFYIVQLANFTAPPKEPGDSDWAELREAQSLTAEHVKNSGIAVTIDIGDANDIHPKNKADVGHRLALAALAKTYGQAVEYSGPAYRSMKIEGNTIRLRFDHLAGGLVAKGGPPVGFAIAGSDRKWHWADAKIDGDTIVVSSNDVSTPVAARYAWANNPPCNLYNQAGLPASPFRTDDWPGVTVGHK